MNAGKTAAYDLLFTLNWSFGGNQTSTANAVLNGARLDCEYANSSTNWVSGLGIHISANTAGPGSPYSTAATKLGFVWNGVTTNYTLGGYMTSGTVTCEITNAKLYSKGAGGGWMLNFDSMVLTGPGGVLQTITSGSISSPFFAPCGIPILGFPAMLNASGGSAISPIVGGAPIYSTTFDWIQSATSTASGGWQIRPHGGTYQALPVTVSYQTPPVCASFAPTPGPQVPTATTTNNGSVSALYQYETNAVANSNTTVTFQNSNCGVMLIPDLTPKKVNRMNPQGSATMIYRAKFPNGSGTVSSSNYDLIGETYPCSQSSTFILNAGESTFLGVPRQTTHTMEDAFSGHSYCIYNSSGMSWKAYGTNAGVQRAEQLSVSSAFLGVLDADWGSGTFTPLTFEPPPSNDTYGLYGKYLNTWCAPHWNYWPYFPPDSETDSNSWPLDGSPQPPSTYWQPIRTQFLHNSSLPSVDGTNTRTDLCTAALGASSTGLWPNGGAWGISNFQAQTLAVPTSFAYSSANSGLFSATNGVAVYGTSITVTPTSVGTVTVTVNLSSFSTAPYFLAQLMSAVQLAAAGSNVTAATASLTGQDGSSYSLGSFLGSATTFNPWSGAVPSPTKYLGSWGQDFGDGATPYDVGSDYTGAGESVTAMANTTQVCAPQLLTGRTATSLVMTFTVNSLMPFTVSYPVLTIATNPIYMSETGMSGSFLYPSGPGVRVGQWDWTPSSSVASAPSIYLLGGKMNVADSLASKYTLFLGTDPVGGTNTELPNIYDSVEGNSVTSVKSGTYGQFVSMGGAPTLVLVNGLAEAPPCASWPVLIRNAGTLQPTTTFGQETWDFTCEPRYLANPTTSSGLYQPGTPETLWTAPAGISQSGWQLFQHTHAVTNSEDATFHVEASGNKYGICSPWHGYLWIGGVLGGAYPYMAADIWGGLHAVQIDSSGDIEYLYASVTSIDWLVDSIVTSGGGWSNPRMCVVDDRRIELRAIYTDTHGNKNAYSAFSYDFGNTFSFSSSPSMANSVLSDIKCSPGGVLLEINAVPSSGTSGPGTFSGRLKHGGDAAFGSAFTLNDSTGTALNHDGSGFGFDAEKAMYGRWLLRFVVNGQTSPTSWWSGDSGATWTQFT